MALSGILYRQQQKILYHTTADPVKRRVAEINRNEKVISVRDNHFYFQNLNLLLPKDKFDFLLVPGIFELFMTLPRLLEGEYLLEDRLYFEFNDVKLEITSRSELYIINEVFVQQCYSFTLPTEQPVRVIDIGMNVGVASLFFAGLGHVKQVYGFEPFRFTFDQANTNFLMNPSRASKILASNFGLGDKNEMITVPYNRGNSGINRTVNSKSETELPSRETVQIRSTYDTIHSIIASHPDDAFVLKVDTEGSEYAIFRSLFRSNLPSQVHAIMLEWHGDGAEQLKGVLLANGFALTAHTISPDSGLIYAFR